MPRIKIDFVLKMFNDRVDRSLSLADDVAYFQEFRNDRYRPILKRKIHLIVELSFLQLFIAWEEFLEQTFTRYMCGSKTASGYLPRRYVQPTTLKHGLDIIKQERIFVDWTKWEEIITRAKLYFENGAPFAGAIGGSLVQLNEMKTIRNRIAHRSKYSEKRFLSLVRNKFGYNPRGMAPGRLLLSRIPSTNPKTVLKEYGDLLLVLGKMIVP